MSYNIIGVPTFRKEFTRLSKTDTSAIMVEICINKGDKRHENENKKKHYIYASADALI